MKKAAVLLALVLASVALVACGSDSDDSTTGGGETTTESGSTGGESSGGLEIAAAESGLAYASDTASTEAGKVTVSFENSQPIAHDVAFEDSSGAEVGQTDVITEGSDAAVVDFKPGSYAFYCTVPGHREAGMEGTLTVK